MLSDLFASDFNEFDLNLLDRGFETVVTVDGLAGNAIHLTGVSVGTGFGELWFSDILI